MPGTWGREGGEDGLRCCHMWRFPPFQRDLSLRAPPRGGERGGHGGGFLQEAMHTLGLEVLRVEDGESKPGISFTGVLASAAASVSRALKDLEFNPSKPRDAVLPVPSCCCSKPQAFLFVFLFRLLIQHGRCRRCFSLFHLSAFPCFLLRLDQNSQLMSEGTLKESFPNLTTIQGSSTCVGPKAACLSFLPCLAACLKGIRHKHRKESFFLLLCSKLLLSGMISWVWVDPALPRSQNSTLLLGETSHRLSALWITSEASNGSDNVNTQKADQRDPNAIPNLRVSISPALRLISSSRKVVPIKEKPPQHIWIWLWVTPDDVSNQTGSHSAAVAVFWGGFWSWGQKMLHVIRGTRSAAGLGLERVQRFCVF